jgi:galactokinase
VSASSAIDAESVMDVYAAAPGRTNLMGEHTDYNEGFVLPVVIPQRVQVAVHRRKDQLVRARSSQQPEPREYTLGEEAPVKSWLDYVQGVTFALRREGHSLSGFELQVSSQVPMGAGLASSAALEIALLRALRGAFKLELADRDLARLGRAAEVDFMGIPIGIMDQMASSLGRPGHALFIDTRTLETSEVRLPVELELVVIDSGVVHAHDGGAYRRRREECERAAHALGLTSLRDARLEQLEKVPLEPLLQRRARHVISENERVLKTREALTRCDRASLRDLFFASHASQRDDFAVSVPEIDLLVSLASECPGVIGARLTGGGFGGSVVALAEHGQGQAAAHRIALEYKRQSGCAARVLLPSEERT